MLVTLDEFRVIPDNVLLLVVASVMSPARRVYLYPGPEVVICSEIDNQVGVRARDGHPVCAIRIASSTNDPARRCAVKLDPIGIVGFCSRRFEHHPRVSQNPDIEIADRATHDRSPGTAWKCVYAVSCA